MTTKEFNPAPRLKPKRPTRAFRYDQASSDLIDEAAKAYDCSPTQLMNTLVSTYLPKLLEEKANRRRKS